MATNESSPRRGGALDTITNLFAIALVLVVGWLAWPYLVVQFQARSALAPGQAQPTQASVPGLSSGGVVSVPHAPVDVQATANAYNAAETARGDAIQATAAAVPAAPQPNVNVTNDAAPVVREQKAVEVAPASAGIVPTSEPVVQTDDQHGSKQLPISIQATHTCLHGQIWTDTGCHNPTPTN